eukprot:g6643.t1
MPVPTRPLGHRLGSSEADIVLEAVVDFCCPFSKRLFERVVDEVLPHYEQKAPGRVAFLHYNQVQPWHAQSSYMHEAALAVEQVDAGLYLPYAKELFAKQAQFFDDMVWDKSRSELYAELSALAKGAGADEAAVAAKLARVIVEGSHNTGNATTNTLKLYTKFCRTRGIHVTPTVLVNGLEEGAISSGWTLQQWIDYLDPLLG